MKFLENLTPRKYQEDIFNTCKDKNCLVVLPTGLGKTLIALMLSIHRMQKFPGEKILFLAPTRPLAEQHMSYFKKNLPELFAGMELFTGSISAGERKKLWLKADIIFSTPQCVSNDVKKGLYNLNEVCLLIEDEAHRCVQNYAYNYVAQVYKSQGVNQRILGLTASPGSEKEKIKDICKNLSIEAVELRTRESADVSSYLQELKFKKILVDLPPEIIEIQVALKELFSQFTDELRSRKLLWSFPSKTELIALQRRLGLTISKGNRGFNNLVGMSLCAQAIKIQHALELLETQTVESFNNYLKKLLKESESAKSRASQRLVSDPKFRFALSKSISLMSEGIENPKIKALIETIQEERLHNKNLKAIVFSQFRETARLISKRLNKFPGVKSKTFVGQAKKTHGKGDISGLSQKEQKGLIHEFSKGKINILCATSIAEEGLDIPEVNLVVFYEPVPSAIRAIQRAGRTARLIEGKLIMLIAKKTRDESHFYVSHAKRKKMHSAIESLSNDMNSNKINFNNKSVQKTL